MPYVQVQIQGNNVLSYSTTLMPYRQAGIHMGGGQGTDLNWSYLKDHWTNTMLAYAHLSSLCIPNPNMINNVWV